MKLTQNIDTSLKTMRIILVVIVALSFFFCSFVYLKSMDEIETSRNKVYLLSQGDALELVRSRNGKDNIKAEIKNHITMFHEFFYNLDPDPVDIKERIGKALYLIDESGQQLHFKRKDALYYHQLVDGNISTRVYIDSIISIQSENEKYHCKIYAWQKFIRSSRITTKRIDGECNIRSVARTDNNPHGFLIEQYRLTNNNINIKNGELEE